MRLMRESSTCEPLQVGESAPLDLNQTGGCCTAISRNSGSAGHRVTRSDGNMASLIPCGGTQALRPIPGVLGIVILSVDGQMT